MSRTNDGAPGLGGEGREEKRLADIGIDCGAKSAVIQPIKPEVDLASWTSLGANVKPSRFNRKQKRGWQRGCS